MTRPRGDTTKAAEFLYQFFDDEPVVVTAVEESNMGPSAYTRVFTKATETDLLLFLNARQGNANLYFAVNPLIDPTKVKKALKTDVRGAKWLHVDVDPRAGETIEDEKVRALKLAERNPLPSLIIDSGNGIQLLWKLTEEFELNGDPARITDIEGRNRKIALDFQGDVKCFNVDRILRIPFTVNVPTKKKLSLGRVAVESKLIAFHPERTYVLKDFTSIENSVKQEDPVKEVLKGALIPESVEVDDVPQLNDELKYVAVHGTHPSKEDRWASRSEMQFWWIIQCRMGNINPEIIASILLDPRYKISEGVLEKRNPKDYAIRQIKRAEQKGGLSDRPIIEVNPSNLDQVLDKAEAAINEAGIEIFQSNGRLVRLSPRGANDAPAIIDVQPLWLLEKFISSAKWVKRGARGFAAFEPKVTVASHYIEREGEWRLPPLQGIVMTPTLRRDLTLLNDPGYDKQSGIFFMANGTKFLPPPEQPTKEDAEKALKKLIEPFKCFPFVPDRLSYNDEDWLPDQFEGLNPSVSRSVVLSAMITAVIRSGLATAPMHAIDAPEKGTGKGLIADCVSILVTGVPAIMMSLGHDETEDRKRLLSTLMTGARMIVIDNVERALQGDALCTILTQEIWQERVLGQSRMEAVSTNSLIMATGNNLRIIGDMTRRVVICRMDAREERPDERKFPFDPRKHVKENRVELINACLTIILAYIADGRPYTGKLKAMGSFDDWSIVREALMWLDQPDPAMSRERIRHDDSARMIISEMMHVWWMNFRESSQRLTSLYSGLSQTGLDSGMTHLRDLCASVCNGSKLNMRDLRKWFEKNSNKIVNKRRFIYINDDGGTLIKMELGVDAPDTIDEEEDAKF